MGDSPNLIDYTALEKRGLIKRKEIKKTAAPISKDGFIDFSAMGQDKINKIMDVQKQTTSPNQLINSMPSLIPLVQSTSVQPSQQNQSPSSTFSSFWDDVPGNQSQSTSVPFQAQSTETSYYNQSQSYYPQAEQQSAPSFSSSTTSNDHIEHIKVKLDDMEYKLSLLTEKLDTITDKLSRFEDKVSYQ